MEYGVPGTPKKNPGESPMAFPKLNRPKITNGALPLATILALLLLGHGFGYDKWQDLQR